VASRRRSVGLEKNTKGAGYKERESSMIWPKGLIMVGKKKIRIVKRGGSVMVGWKKSEDRLKKDVNTRALEVCARFRFRIRQNRKGRWKSLSVFNCAGGFFWGTSSPGKGRRGQGYREIGRKWQGKREKKMFSIAKKRNRSSSRKR